MKPGRFGGWEEVDGLFAELSCGREVAVVEMILGDLETFDGLILIALHGSPECGGRRCGRWKKARGNTHVVTLLVTCRTGHKARTLGRSLGFSPPPLLSLSTLPIFAPFPS